MTHCMLDLETWGTRPGCAIRSIGAVTFDPSQAGLEAEFYVNVDGESCLDAGLRIEAGTAEWWERQSPEARAHLRSDQMPLRDALARFFSFWRMNDARFVWGHGASFDPPILEAAFWAGGEEVPWAFWNVRDTRTLFDLASMSLKAFPRAGTHHNALDDAKHQALAVQAAYKRLGIT